MRFIELYYSPYCAGCGSAPEQAGEDAQVRWIDATTHLEAAARLRITRLPALVADGRVIAQGPHALEHLRTLFDDQGDPP